MPYQQYFTPITARAEAHAIHVFPGLHKMQFSNICSLWFKGYPSMEDSKIYRLGKV